MLRTPLIASSATLLFKAALYCLRCLLIGPPLARRFYTLFTCPVFGEWLTYSICERCKTLTGAWYGQAFVTWTRQGFDWLDKVEGEKALVLPYYIRPLNALKQVLVIAVAMAGERSLKAH